MQPRIYTYKITFEEIPDWYWGVHKEKKYGEPYLGSPDTHAWKWEFYTPHLQICEVFPYTSEGWKKARETENRCILPDLNNPLCLNEHAGGFMSLEANSKGGKSAHKKKDGLGRSALAVRTIVKVHEEKDDLGRSIHGVKRAEQMHKDKDELGRSVTAVKGGEIGGAAAHRGKDELGRSVNGVKNAKRLNKEKDYLGRSVNAIKGAKSINTQKWKDPDHPELGEHNPGNLVRVQKSKGCPHGKENRVKVG
jgi:hypothetical protein